MLEPLRNRTLSKTGAVEAASKHLEGGDSTSNLSHDLGLSECHPLFEIGKFETGSHEPCLRPGATVLTNILGPEEHVLSKTLG
jgi:hypothetical protein